MTAAEIYAILLEEYFAQHYSVPLTMSLLSELTDKSMDELHDFATDNSTQVEMYFHSTEDSNKLCIRPTKEALLQLHNEMRESK